jgi:putative ABC transport system permease protein
MSVLQDIRLALRLLRRAPSVTTISLLSIALSVAATAVVFTAIKSVLIDPLPYARPDELVQIGTEFASFDPAGLSNARSHVDFAFWNDAHEIMRRTRTLESVGVYGNSLVDLAGDGSAPPEALYGLRVSASLFPTLGVTPMLGRNILPEEDQIGHTEVMILNFGLWKRRFRGDRSIVGRNIKINGHECLVIGVMPPQFNFPLRRAAAHTPSPYVEFWEPLLTGGPVNQAGAIGVVARLRRGVSLSQAQQDVASIGAALSREFPATNRDRGLRLGYLLDRSVGKTRNALWFLMAAAVMFLLIGCANVANILLARGLARQREIAIRIAIGAGTVRIVRQLLTESCVLAVLGGIAGYALTAAAWKILPAVAPVSIPRLASARADWPILGFALMVALVNGVLFGIAPAIRAGLTPVMATNDFGVRGASSSGNRLRGWLVITEVAITVVLVVIGAQLMGSFIELLGTDPGFDADHILASVVIPSGARYRTPEDRGIVYGRFLDAVRAIPGAESAGTIDALPFSGENHGGLITSSKAEVMEPRNQLPAEIDVVSPEYLQTMRVHLTEGRWFSEDDRKESSDTAIVNDIAASRLWPGGDPIGQRICVYCTPEKPSNWKRVVGVVSSIRHAALDGPQLANVYVSSSSLERAAFLVVRTNRPSGDMEKEIRRAIASVDPNQPVFLSAAMRTLIADSLADRRFIMSLLAITGFLALAMSIAGVYGVTSYITSRRTQEIGVRMALGATPANVLALVFRQGFFNAAVGLAIGLGLTIVLIRLLRGVLLGLDSGNSGHVSIAVGLVSLTAAFACWFPARRAARIEPMSALRQE